MIPAEVAVIRDYKTRIISLLSGDLDFHDSSSKDFTHDLHTFPAKFPPQLPRKFIDALTDPGELVLDPMVGSGTTVLEALLAGRRAIGLDIDPLALRLCKVKTTSLSAIQIAQMGSRVVQHAKEALHRGQAGFSNRFDDQTKAFIDYWFHPDAQAELSALLTAIETVDDEPSRGFLESTFSGVIITKSGGVSMALDLAHTRPHKVKDKPYRSAIKEFEKRLKQNLKSLDSLPTLEFGPILGESDAQHLPLAGCSVDLIVTSPPYPSNAIDYMRAHKFSLVWFDYPIQTLTQLRKKYIGGETLINIYLEDLPPRTSALISTVASKDEKKAGALSGIIRK